MVHLVKFEDIDEYLGGTNQANYLNGYLSHLNSETCLIEDNYYDKDFLIDYQKFYSRSYEKYPKVTRRVHFFKNIFSREQYIQAVTDNDEPFIDNFYVGGYRYNLRDNQVAFVGMHSHELLHANYLKEKVALQIEAISNLYLSALFNIIFVSCIVRCVTESR